MKLKLLAVISLILVLGVGGWWFIFRIPAGMVRVRIFVAPDDAKVEIDSKTYNATANILLKANHQYTIKVTRKGFVTSTFKQTFVNQPKYAITNTITVGLEAETDEAKAIAKKQQERFLEIEKEAGDYGSEYSRSFEQTHPIVKHLPIQMKTYKIGYIKNDISDSEKIPDITITIYADSFNRMTALRELQSKGLDFIKYKIKFFNLDAKDTKQPINPFEQLIKENQAS